MHLDDPTGGVSPSGGMATGGMTATDGGSSGGVANPEPGAPCTADCPTGMVQLCFDNCPLGACDESQFLADVPCSELYPLPISAETVFCNKGQTGSYCLTALDDLAYDYKLSCKAGTPTVTRCNAGCLVAGEQRIASCNR